MTNYKKIGITGANGFIGNHLLRSAIDEGIRPVAFLQKGFKTPALKDIEGRFEAVYGDLLDKESLDRFLRQCDAVFHLAGLNRYWARDPKVFEKVNVEGTVNVAEGCLKHGISRLVHVSSCITLGASQNPEKRAEDAEFNLANISFPYAVTKKAGEEAVLKLVREKNLPALVVHPTSAIGELDWGPTPIGKPIADICRGMWPVYVAGGACFIDIKDVVRGLWLALDRGRIGEKYLLAGDNLSNQEFMSSVAIAAGRKPPKLKIPKPFLSAIAWSGESLADHVTKREPVLTVGMSALIGKYLYFDGAKAERELGFKAGPTMPAIERSVKWFRELRP